VAAFALSGTIGLDASRFVSGAKQASRAATEFADDVDRAGRDVDDAFGDMGDAAMDFAGDAGKASTKAQGALRETADVAGALQKAIGPDLAAAIGTSNLDALAADLGKAGFAAQDVELAAEGLRAELDRVAAEAGDVGDRAGAGFDKIGDAAKRAGQETDNTRSVVANFAGNATSELPGVASAMGPMNMAIGQFAEYAAEGNIRLKSFAAAAVGLVAVGVALKLVSDHMSKIAAAKAFDKKQVETYRDALVEAGDAAANMVESLEDTGRIEVRGLFNDLHDVTNALAQAGVTADDWAQAVAGGEDELARMATRVREAGVGAGDFAAIVVGLRNEQENYRQATEDAAGTLAVFADEQDRATAALGGTQSTLDTMIPTLHASETATADFAAALADERAKSDEAAQAARDHRLAINDVTLAYEGLRDELSDESTYLNVENAFARIDTAAEDAYIAAATGAADAEAKARDLEAAVIDGKGAVLDYAEQVLALPEEQATKITTLIDQGSYDEAMRLLRNLEQNRSMTLSIQARGGEGYIPGPNRASGGPAPEGRTGWAGEFGPELVSWGSPAYVTPTHAITSALYTMATGPSPAQAPPTVIRQGLMPGDSLTLMVDGMPMRAVVQRQLTAVANTVRQGVRA
jgi:hypothetical protein